MKDGPKLSTKARIRVTVEVEAGSWWGDQSTQAQIFKSAGFEATNVVRQAMQKAGRQCRIIGEPFVITVITQEETDK